MQYTKISITYQETASLGNYSNVKPSVTPASSRGGREMTNQHKTTAEQYARKCIHFNGLMNDRCKAGVLYDDLKGFNPAPGTGLRMPCFKDSIDPVPCAVCHYPTPEEVAQDEAELVAHMEAMRHRNIILGHAHTDEKQSNVFWCQMCDTIFTIDKDAQQHLAEQHSIVGPQTARMLAHLDATEWHQTDTMFAVGGKDVLVRSVRMRRIGSDATLWAENTPKKRGRKKPQ